MTPISSRFDTAVPQVADSLLPIAAAFVSIGFVVLLLRSFRRRRSGEKLLWAGGFGLFAVATVAEALAQRGGWSPGLFRAYYLAGGVLTVAYLGSGSVWMLLPRRGRDALLGAIAAATAAAAVTVFVAPVDSSVLAGVPSGEPPANAALGGHAFLWAIALNSIGTLFLVGCSLLSIVRRQRVRPNVWIACGAICIAAATGLSRAGDTSLLYLGELVGIALMFCGFTLASAAPKPARPAETAPRAAVLAR